MRLDVGGRRVFASTGSGHPAPGAPAVVFIHGGGFDHTVWVMPSRYFARHGYRVFAPDLPGHGRSEGPALDSIDALVAWLHDFLDAVDVDAAAIVGHSMGALVAYGFAAHHPDRTRKLVLLGASLPMPVSEQLLDASADDDHAAINMANTWSHSKRGTLGASDNPGVWMLGAGARLLERANPGVYNADFVACNTFAPEVVSVGVETLVIVGAADRMTPASRGERLAAQMPNARVVTLAGCGHSMLSEQPNEVLDALIDFI